MKKIVTSILATALLLPAVTHALSCVDPITMSDNYVESNEFVIFTGVAGETKEHVKQAADTTGLDPNRQFAEGMTGQFVAVTSLHKGQVSGDLWVYHQKNSTWGYMCSSGPAEAGVETLYIVTPPNGLFDFPQVVNSYPADSQLAQDLVTKLEAAADNGPAYINFTTEENWKQSLSSAILEMVYIIRIKLAEWRWWQAQ